MALVAGSDARAVSPLFTDLDEIPAETDEVPAVSVTSLLRGPLTAPLVSPVPDRPGLYWATLTADDHLVDLDQLTLVWTATVGGAVRRLSSTVTVAGGVYVPTDLLAAQRTLPEARITLDDVRMWRDVFEAVAERARGVAYVPRLAVEDHSDRCSRSITLRWARPRELQALWVDGEPADLDTYDFDPASRSLSGSFAGAVRIAYTHGYDGPAPQPLVVGCRDFVRSKTLADTSDHHRNAISYTDRVSGETYRFGTADWDKGRWTGLESIDTLISSLPDERLPGLA